MKRTIKAIQVFIDYWKANKEIISKKEFDSIWKGSAKYYYRIRKEFLESLNGGDNNG